MNRRDLVELVSVSEWPCVSIVAPLENQGPANAENAIRVKSLTRRAREKLAEESRARRSNSRIFSSLTRYP